MSTVHFRTPTTVAYAPGGNRVRQVHYLRSEASDPVRSVASQYRHDVAGRVTEQRDARLAVAAQTDIHTLSGVALLSQHVDSGRTIRLIGLAGETLQAWDGRATRLRSEYDSQLRRIALHERAEGAAEQTTERIFFADRSPTAAARNVCGRVIEQLDPAGQITFSGYNLNGQPLDETRRFLRTPDAPHWTVDPADNDLQLEPERFVSSSDHDATGALIHREDARQHTQSMTYDIAGQLNRIALQPAGQPEAVLYLNPRYDANGQPESRTYGNAIVDTATYDPADGRVIELKTQSATGKVLQHARYCYDPMGNVLQIVDLTFTARYFANRRVTGEQVFNYDSLSRLINASGCEAQVDPGHPGLPEPSPIDDSLLLNYTQSFSYNDSGGMVTLVHHSDHAGQSRTLEMAIAPDSNRALSKDGAEPDFANSFDPCGNQILLQRGGQPLLYNRRNQLMCCTTIARAAPAASDHEQFVYAANGTRLRTIRTAQAKNTRVISQTRYLPGLELHEKTDQDLEVIVIEAAASPIRCLHWARGTPGVDDYQMRYSHGDHLGSSALETDAGGLLISRERFHPFGTTASWASRSAVEADYKTIRYSGKVMDASGLYYYGLRYYAAWLRHWVGPDPLGNVDGLNRYSMVGNNPVSFVDEQGAVKTSLGPPKTVSINMPSPSSSGNSSDSDSDSAISVGSSAPRPPPTPPPMPPKPDETWRAWTKRMALAAVDSRVGLALLPVATSSPANAAIVSTVLSAAGQLAVYSMFNPGWSLASTWDPDSDGAPPPVDVTQKVNRGYAMTVTAITTTMALGGAILGPVVGGYVDELRGTKDKTEKKTQANKWMDTIDQLIAQQRLEENVTEHARNSLREQVLEVEELIGITWKTMDMLEKITLLGPQSFSTRGTPSRYGPSGSALPGHSGIFQRGTLGRTVTNKQRTKL
ncbi:MULTISPECIES: RHS repeat domain-containing protein [Pseudomonas]|uniref:RHS repeat domain-containing protein n=1 Tax=Pseudomonas TaxID=286 RepID=UPI000710519A|nr:MULTISPECIES: RHS repeat-associated core domain-containing protein [Pseudomonas]KQW09097.1 hypothetical protein ASC85_15010 [Pseudomonas sp. Root401]WHS52502.1 RHS repeat-associated core domain-containing protein [Pseudomonas brassicacearum]